MHALARPLKKGLASLLSISRREDVLRVELQRRSVKSDATVGAGRGHSPGAALALGDVDRIYAGRTRRKTAFRGAEWEVGARAAAAVRTTTSAPSNILRR